MRLTTALALALVGCGHSNRSGEVDEDEIRIGLLLPYTGKDGSAGVNDERGVLMAMDQVNAAGGLYGKRVELVFADTHSDVERGLVGVRGLIDQSVIAVIGPVNDELAQAAALMLGERGIPLLTPSSSSVSVVASPETNLWFRLAPSAGDLGTALGRYMRSNRADKVAIVSTEAAYEVGFAAGVAARLEEAGVEIVSSQTIRADAPDFTEVVRAIVSAQPESIVLAADPSTGSRFVNDYDFVAGARSIQWFLSPSLEQPGFLLNTAPQDVEGMVGVAPAVSPDEARTQAFSDAFMERWNGAVPVTGAYYYYDALALFAVAFEGAATATGSAAPDPETLRSYLLSASGQSGLVVEWDELARGVTEAGEGQGVYYSGLTGVISLNASGSRSTVYTRLWTIREGKIVPL